MKPRYESQTLSSDPDSLEQAKRESETYVKRLTQIQDVMVKKCNTDTVVKVLERLIKNEKFHCKILISIILLLLKQNSKDQKGTDSTFKDQAAGLIKKILKKKVWEFVVPPNG